MERRIKLPTDAESAIDVQQLTPTQHTSSQQHSQQSEMDDIWMLVGAAKKGKWNEAAKYLDKHPNARTSIIDIPNRATLLHVAARAGQSDFILKLLDYQQWDPEDIDKTDGKGNNALHYIVKVGKVEAAKKIVKKKKQMIVSPDAKGNTPLMLATEWGVDSHRDMVKFLAETTVYFLRQCTKEFLAQCTPEQAFTGPRVINVILRITAAGFHDICLLLLRNNPDLVLEVADAEEVPYTEEVAYAEEVSLDAKEMSDAEKLAYAKEVPNTILMVMAKYPELFTRGRIGIYDRFTQPKSKDIVVLHDVNSSFTNSMALVDLICRRVSDSSFKDYYLDGLAPAVHLATKNGILELVQIWLSYFPNTLWQKHDRRLLFHVAVEYRQLDIFRYLINLAGEVKYSIFKVNTESGNILHLAAKKAPYTQLRSVSGSALQLQREFKWFKMVKDLVPNDCKLALDSKKRTPRELFTSEHESLHNEAKDWMRTTSENCMVVTTLVAGVVFASMIQIPGGLDNDGNPKFLKTVPFAVFTAANGLALFASMTSLLIFLAIQTSPYDEDDFADSLPKKLMGGLFTLFLAIAAMVVAFAAALQIAVHSKFRSIYIVSAVFGWIPIYFFGSFQVPLFREMVKSTFCGYTLHRQTQRNCWKRLLGFKDSSQSYIE